jgi:hypothetical protein
MPLGGGRWHSGYNGVSVTSASRLDIGHMVPLAEVWNSGASAWTAKRRESYANDQGQEASLVAVTPRSNRSKSDQDPAEGVATRCRRLLPLGRGVGGHQAPLGPGSRQSRDRHPG